jgi:glutaminase
VRRTFTVGDAPSRRRRPQGQCDLLDWVGHRAFVTVLHGDLVFAGMESVVRGIVERAEEIEIAVLDLTEVTEIDLAAVRLLAGLGTWLGERGVVLAVVAPPDGELLAAIPAESFELFPDLDAATEWCEERLLAAHGGTVPGGERLPLTEHRLARGLEPELVERLAAILEPRRFAAGETIFSAGDPATEVFLLVAGEVRIEIDLGDGRARRLATLMPGLSFGEVAIADVPARPVTVRGESDGEALVLTVADFERLGETDPILQAALMRNLLAAFYEVIGRMTREVGTFFAGR